MRHGKRHANSEVQTAGPAKAPDLRAAFETPAEQRRTDPPPSRRNMICRCLASRNVGIQLGLILLCLAVVTAFGAVLTGTSSATTRDSATQGTGSWSTQRLARQGRRCGWEKARATQPDLRWTAPIPRPRTAR